MIALTLKILQWVLRNVLLLIPLIILTLAVMIPVGAYVRDQYTKMVELEAQLTELGDAKAYSPGTETLESDLDRRIAELVSQSRIDIKRFDDAATEKLKEEIQYREGVRSTAMQKLADVEERIRTRRPLTPLSLFPDPKKTVNNHVTNSVTDASEEAQLKLKIDVLSQEINFLRRTQDFKEAVTDLEKKKAECAAIAEIWLGRWKAYQRLRGEVETAKQQGKRGMNAAEYWLKNSGPAVVRSAQKYNACRRAVNEAVVENVPDYLPDTTQLSDIGSRATDLLSESFDRTQIVIAEVESEVQKKLSFNFVYLALNNYIKPVIGLALLIWIAYQVLPKAYRFVLHQLLAPIAARQSPIQLIPSGHRNETITGATPNAVPKVLAKSGVEIAVTVDPSTELLCLPEYVKTLPSESACSTGYRYFLDRRYVGLSIISGLYNLESVTAFQQCEVGLSTGEDVLAELSLIDVPEGSAISIRAGYLVALIHPRKSPVRLESRWQWAKMQAWLTFQFRYLIFRGPLQLVVRGSKGVIVRTAGTGDSIPQNCTIGFSANLSYSTVRSEPFEAYLWGKTPLLRDRFEGESGIFVYEGRPSRAGAAGASGRGLEVLMDAMGKAIGV